MESGEGRNSLIKPQISKAKPLLWLCSYNIRTLLSEERMIELEEELQKIKWDVIGLSEVRRRGENQVTLRSGNLFHYKGLEDKSEGGVGFIVHKRHLASIKEIKSISSRVIYLVIRLNTRYSLKIIQAYAPTSDSDEEDVEVFYEDLNTALHDSPTHFTIMMGDFNAKLGRKQDEAESSLGAFGYGKRNERGDRLLNYIQQQELFALNSFFNKKSQNKWTWISPDGKHKNEIDYCFTYNREIVQDLSVLNNFTTGSDHRMIRAKVALNIKKERIKLMSKTKSNRWVPPENLESYQNKIAEVLDKIKHSEDEDIDIEELNASIGNSIKSAEKEHCSRRKTKDEKISQDTKELMRARHELKNKYEENYAQLRELNKQISKAVRRDVRRFNSDNINKTIQENKGLKVLKKKLSQGKKDIYKLRDKQGIVRTNREEILKIVESFYAELYKKQAEGTSGDKITRVLNQGSEDIPEITVSEITRALSDMKNNKTPGEDGLVIEAIKMGGNKLLQAIKTLFNACLLKGITPSDWNNAVIILLHKKGDITNIGNYRPISLLSHVYKLFTKIITRRLSHKLDSYQTREQAGFRTGYGTNDHLQVLKSLIEKCVEYNKPLVFIFVDYEKAFDSVDQHTMLRALSDGRIDYRYSTVIKYIYENATACVRLHDNTDKFNIERGVRQGDTISPKLFNSVLQYMFKQTNWDNLGVNINGERLNHLRFADDIVLIADRFNDAILMLKNLNEESKKVGLKINFPKTKIMTNLVLGEAINIDGTRVEETTSFKYLGHEITIGRDNQTLEISRRIGLAWAAYGNLKYVFKAELPNCLKRKVFDQCVLPVLTYGAETLTLTKRTIKKIRVTQLAMERSMLGISLRDHIPNNEIRRRSGAADAVERITALKWNWAGHIARFDDDRWTRRILEWRPRSEAFRNRGRPPTRWTDDLKRVSTNWMQAAQDRRQWKLLREAYVQQWTLIS